jgi:hypothetical protein
VFEDKEIFLKSQCRLVKRFVYVVANGKAQTRLKKGETGGWRGSRAPASLEDQPFALESDPPNLYAALAAGFAPVSLNGSFGGTPR